MQSNRNRTLYSFNDDYRSDKISFQVQPHTRLD
jgi:hypothetical protein